MAEKLLLAAAGLAVAAGLAGAFIGLSVSGFWIDEFWTAWTIGNGDGVSAVLGRAVADVHPPLYYLVLDAWTSIFGRAEAGMRSLSAAAAVAAIAVFGIGTRHDYSLPARLVALALAVASTFWFDQSQIARSYGLVMLVAALELVLGLRLCRLEQTGRACRRTLLTLIIVALLGAGIHLYLVILGIAVLLALIPFRPKLWRPIALAAVALGVLAFGYVRLVMAPNSVVLVDKSWIESNRRWYQIELLTAYRSTASGRFGPVVVGVLAAGLAAAALHAPWRRRVGTAVAMADRRLFPLLVPLLVVIGGVISSIVLSPNFTARNVLVSAPFLWAAVALAYDAGVGRAGRWRPAFDVLLALAMLGTMTRQADRLQTSTTPYRESAAWIAGQPGCAGAPLLVFMGADNAYKPGEAERHALSEYGYYLKARPLVPVMAGAPLGAAPLPQASCGVVAWAAHLHDGDADAEILRRQIEQWLGRPVSIRRFAPARGRAAFKSAFVFVAQPPADPRT